MIYVKSNPITNISEIEVLVKYIYTKPLSNIIIFDITYFGFLHLNKLSFFGVGLQLCPHASQVGRLVTLGKFVVLYEC